jgi:hypothetical protein
VLDGGERRRPSWHAFRRAYPTFLKIASVLLLLLVAFDLWLWYRQRQYQGEIDRLRGAMTESERDKSDLLIEAEQSKVKMALALARHQARWDPQLHLAVAVDSGRMYLMRDGAMLRDMRVSITPEPIPVVPGDSAERPARSTRAARGARVAPTARADMPPAVRPRGERTIQEIQTDSAGRSVALLLVGGTRIYGSADSTTAQPGDVRLSPADFKAILASVTPGMVVYFY